MNKNVIAALVTILLFSKYMSFAQSNSYHIPGAKMDAAFIFPFWLEDNNGNKDTLYVCFDPLWSNIPSDSNMTKLGHFKRGPLQNTFIASTEYPDSFNNYKTTGVNLWGNYSAHIWIKFKSACQIKLSWDVQLLRNSILPFQNVSSLPKAMGGLSFSQTPATVPGPFYQNDIYFSDTLNPLQYFSYHPVDHLNISWTCESDSIYDFYFWLRQWDDFTNTITIKNIDERDNLISVYPNPTNSIAFIKWNLAPDCNNCTLKIINVLGEAVKEEKGLGEKGKLEISTSYLQPGIYHCLLINNGAVIQSKELVIAR